MNWKKFLELKWRKVILALILQSLYSIYLTYSSPNLYSMVQIFQNQGLIVNLISGLISNVANFLIAYLISAAIFSVYEKIKKKK